MSDLLTFLKGRFSLRSFYFSLVLSNRRWGRGISGLLLSPGLIPSPAEVPLPMNELAEVRNKLIFYEGVNKWKKV